MTSFALPGRRLIEDYVLSVHFAGKFVTIMTSYVAMSALK